MYSSVFTSRISDPASQSGRILEEGKEISCFRGESWLNIAGRQNDVHIDSFSLDQRWQWNAGLLISFLCFLSPPPVSSPPPSQQNQIFSVLPTPTPVIEYQQEGCLCVRFTGRLECQPPSQCRVSSKRRHPFIHPSLHPYIFELHFSCYGGCARGAPWRLSQLPLSKRQVHPRWFTSQGWRGKTNNHPHSFSHQKDHYDPKWEKEST